MQLRDLIRMNRLVRGGVDLDGFLTWSGELAPDQLRELVDLLVAYAFEAGVRQEDIAEVERRAPGAMPVEVREALATAGVSSADELREVVDEARPDELAGHLAWAVQLFGVAEGRVFAGETAEHCNHWWHRDLTDPRVVADLLADPRYWRTSMRDDRRVKGR